MYIHLIRDISVMTVGAVSLYQYSTSYNYDTTSQYKYFGMVVSDERLQQLMLKYGIIETGDSKNDLDALYKAMYPNAVSQATAASQANQVNPAAKEPSKTAETNGATASIPWANLMGQVGLVPTGDLAVDYVAFGNKLAVMQASATTQDQKANIWLLQAEAAIVFTPPTSTTTALASSSAPPQPQTAARASGADIQAQLNKLLLVF